MEDHQILALFYARSEQAIEELSKKYGAVCHSIANRLLNSPQDAEECVNDAYLGVWNTIPPQKPEYLAGYLYRIVRNLAVARYHTNTAQKRNRIYDLALEELAECIPSGTFVEEEIAAKELSQLLNQFLENLQQENRVMFVRRYWYGDSVTEIASRYHKSSNYVSVQLFRLRSKLKKFLKKEGYHL